MQTISADEFKKRYGDQALAQFDKPVGRPTLGDAIKNSFNSGVNQVKSGFQQVDSKTDNPIDLIEGVGKIGSGAINTALSPLAPLTNKIGEGLNKITEPIQNNPTVQKFANSKAGEVTSRVAEDVANYSNIAGTVGGAMEVPKVSTAVTDTAKNVVNKVGETVKPTGTSALHVPGENIYAKITPKQQEFLSNETANIPFGEGDMPHLTPVEKLQNAGVREVSLDELRKVSPNAGKALDAFDVKNPSITSSLIPSKQAIINDQVAKAFDLTQGDLRNISKATGNDVGKFVADNDLIGTNVESTKGLINDFFKKNYDAVRQEIGKVNKVYTADEIPRYEEALTELKKQTGDVAGLQNVNSEIDTLLQKKNVTLEDVQRVKELMDDHFSLYKVTGDVKEGVAKQGLTNIRKDLKTFIENQVKENTGTDIKQLNNNVSTSRSITDAIENRATRGLTRAHLSLSDLSLFSGGSLAGSPLLGAALVFAKRLIQNPSIQLRVAKFIKGLSDTEQAGIKATLEAGKVPTKLNEFVK